MAPDPGPPNTTPVSDDVRARLDAYLCAVLDASRRVNLTGIRADDVETARRALVTPSYALLGGWERSTPPATVLDIGSGNGFPGVVAAVAWPDARVLLVERRKKKAAAIERCLASVGIGNAEVFAEDVRETAAHRPALRERVDLITARGVGSLADVNRLAAPLLAPGGRVLHWKATNTPAAELTEGDAVAQGLGWSARREWRFEPVPPGPSRLVGYERPAEPSA
ncbi:MAG: class I SAM-dependent methyltransferase [Planctomycetota bacterium]|nr:class I SAM-dependent methyltransferase [Planctomycetota bacterium]